MTPLRPITPHRLCRPTGWVQGGMWVGLTTLALAGCGAELISAQDGLGVGGSFSAAEGRAGALHVVGPAEVRVERLGPVEPPRVLDEEGVEVSGLRWSVQGAEVAQVEQNVIIARAPGEVGIIGRHGEDEVRWRLVVDPAISFRFVSPPASVLVGQTVRLRVAPDEPDQPFDAASLEWRSSDPAILQVTEAGEVQGRVEGWVWVTAEGYAGSQATLQLEVLGEGAP